MGGEHAFAASGGSARVEALASAFVERAGSAQDPAPLAAQLERLLESYGEAGSPPDEIQVARLEELRRWASELRAALSQDWQPAHATAYFRAVLRWERIVSRAWLDAAAVRAEREQALQLASAHGLEAWSELLRIAPLLEQVQSAIYSAESDADAIDQARLTLERELPLLDRACASLPAPDTTADWYLLEAVMFLPYLTEDAELARDALERGRALMEARGTALMRLTFAPDSVADHMATGQLNEARAELERTLAENPDELWARPFLASLLGDVLRKLGETGAALEALATGEADLLGTRTPEELAPEELYDLCELYGVRG